MGPLSQEERIILMKIDILFSEFFLSIEAKRYETQEKGRQKREVRGHSWSSNSIRLVKGILKIQEDFS